MNRAKERFYHAQASKLDRRRKWQCMVVFPLIARFGDRLRMELEYQHSQFKIDLYIPALHLAIEVDEPFHDRQHDADARRMKCIEGELNCEFIRIRVNHDSGLFLQVDELCHEIERRIAKVKPKEWSIPSPRQKAARNTSKGYSEAHRLNLEQNGIPARVSEMRQDLESLQILVTDELGPVIPANGELGFSVVMPGITFCISVRSSGLAKMLVTEYSPSAATSIGITLDGPKKGRVPYWVINELQGRFEIESLTGKLATFQQILQATLPLAKSAVTKHEV